MKVLIVDDHPVVRDGLKQMLKNNCDIDAVKTAGNFKDGISVINNFKPDIVIVDLKLPDRSGLDLIHEAKKIHKGNKFMILTSYASAEEINLAFSENVNGYILKSALPEEIISALKLIQKGKHYIDPEIMEKYFEGQSRGLFNVLTPREKEILYILAQGLSNKEIAEKLYISETTVKKHIGSILLKLQLRDRTQAALYACRHLKMNLKF